MAIEKVKAYFREHGMEERIQEFDESSATVELAAKALHCEPQRIAKTLSFMRNGWMSAKGIKKHARSSLWVYAICGGLCSAYLTFPMMKRIIN